MAPHVRFWRWRRNALKRGTDRAEAVIALTVIAVLTLGAPAVGITTGLRVVASAARPAPGWHRVPAVLVEHSPPAVVVVGVDRRSEHVRATVRWKAADGVPHTGQAVVRPDLPAGSRTLVWLDGTGALRNSPLNPARAQSAAVLYGTAASVTTAGLAGGVWMFTLSRLNRRRSSQLTREWALIGPEWRRHRA
jgi:hypothetical protein